LASCSTTPARKTPRIELDAKSPKQILDLFKFIKKSDSKIAIEKKIDECITSRPFQVMFSHYNRSWNPNKLPKDSMKHMILSLKYEEAYKGHEHRVTNFMKPVWEKYYTNISLFEKEIDYLSKIDMNTLISNALNKANELLPRGVLIPDFYFFIHPNGRSNGFVIKNSHGLDFFQLPKSKDGTIDKDYLEMILTHEIHHLGLATLMPPELYDTKENTALNVLSMPIGEGVANKFINNAPGGCTSKVDSTRKSYYSNEVLVGWSDYNKSENKIFNKFIDLFNRAFAGSLTKKQFYTEFKNYWIKSRNKSRPRFYFLGAEIMGVIYQGLGKNACLDVMKDPTQLFVKYTQALESNPTLKQRCPSIPRQTVINSSSLIFNPKK